MNLVCSPAQVLGDTDGKIALYVLRHLLGARPMSPDRFPPTEGAFLAVARRLGYVVGQKRSRRMAARLLGAGLKFLLTDAGLPTGRLRFVALDHPSAGFSRCIPMHTVSGSPTGDLNAPRQSATRKRQLAPRDSLGDLPGHPAEERIPPLVHAPGFPPIVLTETSPAGAFEWTARSGLTRDVRTSSGASLSADSRRGRYEIGYQGSDSRWRWAGRRGIEGGARCAR